MASTRSRAPRSRSPEPTARPARASGPGTPRSAGRVSPRRRLDRPLHVNPSLFARAARAGLADEHLVVAVPVSAVEGSEHVVLGDYDLDVPLVTADPLY